jgi:16S rRNA (cytosine967-C5)-methyltransferase
VRDGRLRRRVLEVYTAAAADWRAAPGTIARAQREARDLHSRERRFLGEAIFALVRWRRRLAFVAQGTDDAAPLVLYLAWLASDLGPYEPFSVGWTAARAEAKAVGVDLLRLGDADGAIAAIVDDATRLGVAQSIPDWLARRFLDELGADESAKLLAAMNRRAPLTVRANRLKLDRDALVGKLANEGVVAHPVALAPDALTLETHLNAYGLAAFRDGLFEVQDAGSQIIAELVAPPPRGVVVDACAGAGGKTLALGALMGNRGRLVALDVSARKLAELRERARRAGLTNARALAVDEQATSEAISALGLPPADRVLCDAPCSGVGVLRRNPEARWRLTPGDLDELPARQRAILDRYAPLVAPGGRLIYATCTVLRRENDEVIDGFLAAHPEWEEVPAKEIVGGARAAAIGDGRRLRLLPHLHDTDGFFAAVVRRRRAPTAA